ncbi:patatin-like phospholipase, partial [Trichoderma arundinaceum]
SFLAPLTDGIHSFFPARRIGSSTIFQDGFEIPLPLARAEGRKLWPHKEEPDYILSLGCGVMQPVINIRRNFLSRYMHYSLSSLNGPERYDKYEQAFGKMNRCYRIDPRLQMKEVQLDDTSAIPLMKEKLEKDLSVDAGKSGFVDDLSWKMVASLFWFEFIQMPSPTEDGVFECSGEVACRYGDDPLLMETLSKRYPSMRIFIGGQSFAMNGGQRTHISFTQDSWCTPFDIVLECDSRYAAITGFPDSIENILSQQHMGTPDPWFIRTPEPSARPKKRKFEGGDQPTSFHRPQKRSQSNYIGHNNKSDYSLRIRKKSYTSSRR